MPPIKLKLEHLNTLFAGDPLDLRDPQTGATITLELDDNVTWRDLVGAVVLVLKPPAASRFSIS